MAIPSRDFQFSFSDLVAGYFQDELPARPGRFRYMPCRSLGHRNMHKSLQAGERTECCYIAGGQRVTFEVIDCPEYGVLELSGFATDADQKSDQR